MNAGGRLAVYAAGLAIAFAGAFGISAVAVPHSVVTGWEKNSTGHDHSMSAGDSSMAMQTQEGVSASADGYVLSQLRAPSRVGQAGALTFQIQNAAGRPLVDYAITHDKQLHLIVVRSDGTRFHHVHPTLAPATGTWSIPWTWDAAGTYRVYTDFASATSGQEETLTSTVDVPGDFQPAPAAVVSTTDQVDGFTASINGKLTAGSMSQLTVTFARDGKPVTTVQPYLGAFGHLVALRVGDLAYMHIHPQGNDPKPGDTAGPTVSFDAEAPTAGTYRLYLDFQVDGQVHTAEFVLDAAPNGSSATQHTDSDSH